MTLKSLTIFAVLAAGFGFASDPAMAQSKINNVPANFPPASFSGKQFVDNRGCVFVRAGFDGAVNWVPRVSRQRTQICGQKPTFGSVVAAPAAKPAPKPAPKPVAAAPAPKPKPAARPAPKPVVTAAPKPKRKPVPVAVAPAPKPKARAAQRSGTQVVRTPASKPVAAQPPRVVRQVPRAAPRTQAPTTTVRRVIPSYDACANGHRTKVVDGVTVALRCGPQKAPHVTVIRRGEAPGPGKKVYHNRGWQGSELRGNTVIVPRHVYEKRDTAVAAVPEGYRPAWEDDRLNTRRAYQTVAGYMDTQRVWTNTVPRELAVQNPRHKIKAPVIAYSAKGSRPVVSTRNGPVAKAPVISTRSQPRSVKTDARYVEIGVFTTEAKARAAAARLSRSGLPVKYGTYTRGGQKMRSVMVGPYASPRALTVALNSVKAAGYTRAYTR
ncbi:MAG: SPOR domain-containing protein [Pelagimonas sp.]|uniref:SPOR domain-containing protein n=1 Tax=Pelagimonas sp. TaxID=2073170 RepID=UPI003D6AF0F7